MDIEVSQINLHPESPKDACKGERNVIPIVGLGMPRTLSRRLPTLR